MNTQAERHKEAQAHRTNTQHTNRYSYDPNKHDTERQLYRWWWWYHDEWWSLLLCLWQQLLLQERAHSLIGIEVRQLRHLVEEVLQLVAPLANELLVHVTHKLLRGEFRKPVRRIPLPQLRRLISAIFMLAHIQWREKINPHWVKKCMMK